MSEQWLTTLVQAIKDSEDWQRAYDELEVDKDDLVEQEGPGEDYFYSFYRISHGRRDWIMSTFKGFSEEERKFYEIKDVPLGYELWDASDYETEVLFKEDEEEPFLERRDTDFLITLNADRSEVTFKDHKEEPEPEPEVKVTLESNERTRTRLYTLEIKGKTLKAIHQMEYKDDVLDIDIIDYKWSSDLDDKEMSKFVEEHKATMETAIEEEERTSGDE